MPTSEAAGGLALEARQRAAGRGPGGIWVTPRGRVRPVEMLRMTSLTARLKARAATRREGRTSWPAAPVAISISKMWGAARGAGVGASGAGGGGGEGAGVDGGVGIEAGESGGAEGPAAGRGSGGGWTRADEVGKGAQATHR